MLGANQMVSSQQALAASRECEAAVAWLIEHEEADAAESLRREIESVTARAARRSISIVEIGAYAYASLAIAIMAA